MTSILDWGPAPSAPVEARESFDRNAWGTPDYILGVVRESFGGTIDVDPANNAKAQERVRAKCWFGEGSPFGPDGLDYVWYGRVFLNPPYGKGLILPFAEHLSRMWSDPQFSDVAAHAVLVNLDPSTGWFRVFAGCSTHLVMLDKRVAFLRPDTGKPVTGNPRPQCLFLRGCDVNPYRKLGTVLEIK